MNIRFTKHAVKKFEDLKILGIKLTKNRIKNTIRKPENIDNQSDFPNIIASQSLDEAIVLRVVYRLEEDVIIIITFYPAKKGRYYLL